MLTAARPAALTTPAAPNCGATASTRRTAAGRSVRLTVKLMSVTPACSGVTGPPVFCTMVSTLMLASASGSNRAAARPGRSGTPCTVILATLAL